MKPVTRNVLIITAVVVAVVSVIFLPVKYWIFGPALLGSLFLGVWPGGIAGPKPAWWRWIIVVTGLALVGLGFGLPTAGTFGGAAMVQVSRGTNGAKAVVPIRGDVTHANQGTITLKDLKGKIGTVDVSGLDADDQASLTVGSDVIIAMKREDSTGYKAEYIVSYSPILALPLIPALEERARNLYFHVPSAWLAQFGWFVALWYGILYLWKRRPEDDIISSSAAAVGALFCILATVTGSVWAKFNWGSFWNWDPRQLSIFIVLIIYGAYFALRSAIGNSEQRARLSSIYLALLVVPVTYFIFVFPRQNPGLHPGAEGSGSIGPVIDPRELWLDHVKLVIFAIGFFVLSLLYFWMVNLSVRSRLVEIRRNLRKNLKGEKGDGTDTQRYTISAIDPESVRHP